MNWIEDSIKHYYEWLKSNTFVHTDQSTGWTSISTPFTGMYNDCIEIYAKKDGNEIMLSDDGVTIKNLELVGAGVTRSPKRKRWMEKILFNYGVSFINDELRIQATLNNFAQKKHNLISAIAEITDMEVLARHNIASIFKEDVQQYLDEQNLIYTPQFIAKGITGIEFTFDFQIAGKKSEIVLKSFNSLNKNNVPNFLFGWDDIKSSREKITGKELRGLAFVNDTNEIKSEFLDALTSKGADYILWKKRFEPDQIKKLVA